MKKFIIFLSVISCFLCAQTFGNAQEVLQASVSMEDRLPPEFFGSWKVVSVQTSCSNPMLSAPFSIDIWNLSRVKNVITLNNPQTGAIASVKINEVNKNTVTFTRTSTSETEFVTETPTITINGENFVGTDKIVIKNYKYGHHVSTDTWTFTVKAKKISGASTQSIFKK